MNRDRESLLLLDTHVWVWYVEGERRRFNPRIERPIERAVAAGSVVVAAISVWEVAQLASAGRLELSLDVRSWVDRALGFPGVKLKNLSPAIAIESTRLPGNLHRDPADRLLVATAKALGASLVTCDERLLDYASQGHVRAVDARP